MELRDVLRRRRMVRHFTDEPVGSDALERVLAAAGRGPSAGFTQGVSLVVATEAATRRRIAEIAGESWYVGAGHHPFLSEAPVHVVLCTSEAVYQARYRLADKAKPDGSEKRWPVPWWWFDAGATLSLLLLAATDEGLATAFVGVREPRDLNGLLGIPDDVAACGVLLLGHGAPDKPSRSLARGRRPVSEVVHREKW